MHSARWTATIILTGLLVLGLVLFRLLVFGSQVASAAGLGRLWALPKGVQQWIKRWLFGDRVSPV
jgi:hypothetical protein